MSITLQRPDHAWQTRAGWGIAVDLTPQEVVVARHVRVHQRLIALGLLVVLGLCVALALLTHAEKSSAESDYAQEQARTGQLATGAQEFDVITTMQTVTTQIRTSLAGVMSQDVDVVNLMARIGSSLPTGLTVNNISVLLTPAPAADGGAPVAAGPQIIGTVTVAGSGTAIRDVTPFVANLNTLRGVTDVVPTSVTQSDIGMDFTMTLNITDELYTQRYALAGAQ